MEKVTTAIGTILIAVIALVAADMISGAIARARDRRIAAKATETAAANGGAAMQIAA